MNPKTKQLYHGLNRRELSDFVESSRKNGVMDSEDLKEYGIESGDRNYIFKVLDAKNYYKLDSGPGGETSIGEDTLQNKYLSKVHKEQGPLHLWYRQARAISSVEKTEEQKRKYEMQFMDLLDNFKFVPGGRIMHGAGREDITTTLNNCYVVGIKEDSIEAIYQTLIDEATTYKFGGGCGHDLSILRPAGDAIHKTGGESCGPTGFMNLFSENTNTIAQHGRRGANMQTLRVDHPDIEKFIKIKTGDNNKVKYSNISVLLTHDFMNAVQNDQDFDLQWNDNIYKTVNARKLWDQIVSHAHASAEPGLIFWDTMKEFHNAEYVSPLSSTNPCAEQPLPEGGCCNLGAMNLERYVTNEGVFLGNEFKQDIIHATRFLDNVIDYNLDRHALDEQKENAKNDRRIGLGIMGLEDMLVKMGLKYDSEEAIEKVDEIMATFRDSAYHASIELAKEKGQFPHFDWEGYSQSKFVQNLSPEMQEKIKKHGIRNSTLTTVAPTGSGAIVARVTSGIEPIFATKYKRRVKNTKESESAYVEYDVIHSALKNLELDPENLPEHVVTAHEIDPLFRIKMQGTIQKYIDSSISSTVNLARDVDAKTVADIYMNAWKQGLKGVTVYREGAREGILVTEKKENKLEKTIKKLWSKRPKNVIGVTREIKRGEKSLFITMNTADGVPYEIFVNKGNSGSKENSYNEALGRLISLDLQYGVSVKEIAGQLKGIEDEKYFNGKGASTLSDPDAIGQVMEEYYLEKPMTKEGRIRMEESKKSKKEEETNSKTETHFSICPECKERSLEVTGGCSYCHTPDCDYDKCD